tara:strand:- start:76 stop:1374 length:1299 start_codon:yes stop_codon:yes gene_type:complete
LRKIETLEARHYFNNDQQPIMSGKTIKRGVTLKNMYARIVYKSFLSPESNNKGVMEDIIRSSEKNNSASNIGGKLIWEQSTSSVLQILEGPVENVDKIFDTIKKDNRHYDISLVACQDISKEQRLYPIWTITMSEDTATTHEPDISDYQILSIIGTGGFATVVKAMCKKKQTFAAIKIMSKKRLTNNNYNIALRERAIWKELNDTKFINKLHFCLQDPLNVYFVMDFASRGDMYSCVNSCTLDYNSCVFYFGEILCGLNSIHSNGIVFGDLKLENILIDHSGHILLTDFGISRKRDETDKNVRGTPVYFAPEMITEKLIHSKSDIWALGIILYEMTGSRLPWQGLNHDIMFQMILNVQLSLNVIFDNNLNELIQFLSKKDHSERPDCHAIIQYLKIESFIDDWDQVQSRSLEPPHLPDLVNESNNIMMNFGL